MCVGVGDEGVLKGELNGALTVIQFSFIILVSCVS